MYEKSGLSLTKLEGNLRKCCVYLIFELLSPIVTITSNETTDRELALKQPKHLTLFYKTGGEIYSQFICIYSWYGQ